MFVFPLLCLSLSEGKPFDPQYTLSNAVGNIIGSMVFGHRFEYSDASFRRILELDNEAVVLAGSARTQVNKICQGWWGCEHKHQGWWGCEHKQGQSLTRFSAMLIALRQLPLPDETPARTSSDRPRQLQQDYCFPGRGGRQAHGGLEPRRPPRLYRYVPGGDGKGEIATRLSLWNSH